MDAKYLGTYSVGRQVTWAEKCTNTMKTLGRQKQCLGNVNLLTTEKSCEDVT